MSRKSRGDWAQARTLGFSFVASVLVFTALGYLLDTWLHTQPWLMVTGVFAGGAVGFLYLVAILFADSSRGRGRLGSRDEVSPSERSQGQGKD
jgi:F0F1-type ATP synthase assembly protein I